MKKSLSSKVSPSDFNPELVSTMRSVLDTATVQIEKAHRTPATKAKIAQRILLAASDADELTAIAIAEGKHPAD